MSNDFLTQVMENPALPDAVAKSIRIATRNAVIPTDEYDHLIAVIKDGLANPEHRVKLALARLAVRKLDDYSPTRVLEELAEVNSDG